MWEKKNDIIKVFCIKEQFGKKKVLIKLNILFYKYILSYLKKNKIESYNNGVGDLNLNIYVRNIKKYQLNCKTFDIYIKYAIYLLLCLFY